MEECDTRQRRVGKPRESPAQIRERESMNEATATDQTVCLISAVLVLEHDMSLAVDLQAGSFAFCLSLLESLEISSGEDLG